MYDNTTIEFPIGTYWLDLWSKIPRSDQIIEKKDVYYRKNDEIPVTTEAECEYGIFDKSLENEGEDSRPLDRSWHNTTGQ